MRPYNQVERVDLKTGDTIDGRYRVRKILGQGSYGVVYLVDEYGTGRPFALKLLRLWEVMMPLRTELARRFEREYEAGRIDSECLVGSLSKGEINVNPYILMEYCPGGDLTPFLGKVNSSRAADICHDILVGLNALHTHAFVHRDLKPENVLFKANGIAAITDFGIVGDQMNPMTNNDTKDIFGTHAYMAPEQRKGKGATKKLTTTDMFSFGVLTYQLLTGKLPFGPLDKFEDLEPYVRNTEKGIWDDTPLKYVDHSQLWYKLIDGCLQADYTKRIRSASAADRLLPPVGGKGQASRPPIVASYKPEDVTRGYRLRMMSGQERDHVYNLTIRRNGRLATLFTIGRQDDNDICVRNNYKDYVSRHHCTLEAEHEAREWRIRDGQWDQKLGRWKPSRNGTHVNSRPVRPMGYFLLPGDIITMGDVAMRFENY